MYIFTYKSIYYSSQINNIQLLYITVLLIKIVSQCVVKIINVKTQLVLTIFIYTTVITVENLLIASKI